MLRKIISWIFALVKRWFTKDEYETLGRLGWGSGKIERKMTVFCKPRWNAGFPYVPGRYIVKHRGKIREAVLKPIQKKSYANGILRTWTNYVWVADYLDMVPMKGVTTWRPMCNPLALFA